MDLFHRNPSRQQNLTSDLKSPQQAHMTIQDCHLSFTATPIFDDRQERIGTVMEWVDLSEQIAIENAVQQVVQGARSGILHQRLETRNREGFFKNLSESINELLSVNETVIGESIDSLSAMASGDLTQIVKGNYQGEFEQLKNNINTSIKQLASMIEQITQTASAVENGVSEIAAGNENLAQRTENQVSALERSASAMEQINGTIQQSAHHAMEATRAADNAKRRADDGGAVIGSAIEAMDAIREANNSIQSITDLIDSIAFQTNLLALNAAVEAAHAAGHGQGFGVVASEVRQLAHRTSVAAREVQDLIRNSLEKVQGGTSLVAQSGTILNEIIDQSTAVSGMIEEISNASQEQAAGVKQISLTITQLDQATQENGALVQQTSAANQCLLDETRHLAELVERFRLPSHPTEENAFPRRGKHQIDAEPA